MVQHEHAASITSWPRTSCDSRQNQIDTRNIDTRNSLHWTHSWPNCDLASIATKLWTLIKFRLHHVNKAVCAIWSRDFFTRFYISLSLTDSKKNNGSIDFKSSKVAWRCTDRIYCQQWSYLTNILRAIIITKAQIDLRVSTGLFQIFISHYSYQQFDGTLNGLIHFLPESEVGLIVSGFWSVPPQELFGISLQWYLEFGAKDLTHIRKDR